jgi:capsular polysaccharide transport system permease protein
LSETSPVITEIKLEPSYSKGELVPDQWWVPEEPEKLHLLRRHWLFIVTFCLPVALASLYLGVIAADQFISETSFIVRTSARSDMGNLASLMQGQKLSRATDETFAVSEYLTSRDAMQALVQNSHLREILARPEADMFNRFPNFFSRQTDEDLYQHFERFLDVKIDSESGISTLRVRAFTPGDAHELAAALLQNGEALVNRLNARAYDDALRFAKQLIEEQKAKVIAAEEQLTKFRNAQKVIDPNKESAAALESVGTMMYELMELEANYTQQSAVAAQSPSLGPMLEKIRSYRAEIAKQRAQIVGDEGSMAGKLAAYDNLLLNRELAAKGLEAAVVHLTAARQDAEQQQLYLQTIIEPNYADQSRYPKRMLSLLLVMALSFCVFWITKSFRESILEHQA